MLTTQKAAEKLNVAGLQYSSQDIAEMARKGILLEQKNLAIFAAARWSSVASMH